MMTTRYKNFTKNHPQFSERSCTQADRETPLGRHFAARQSSLVGEITFTVDFGISYAIDLPLYHWRPSISHRECGRDVITNFFNI